ncbi:MAG: lactate utilization protein [Bacillota bacterium]
MAGARPGEVPGAGDLAERFVAALSEVQGIGLRARDPAEAVAAVVQALRERGVTEVVAAADPILGAIGLPGAVRAAGIAWWEASPGVDPQALRAAAARAGAGITGVDWALAAAGTLVLMSRPGRPRSLSLLPPLHVAVITEDQLLPDLPDLFRHLSRMAAAGEMPGSLNLITGPSRTADIEHTLVRRVHGPGELLAVVLPAR